MTDPLPPDRLAIAMSVAGQGRPACRLYHPDRREEPCLPTFSVTEGKAVNGQGLAGHIIFTRGAITRLTDDEFALLAGHELAHWYLGHTRTDRAAELAADRLGAKLACRAGHDPASGITLFRFLKQSRVHPPRAQRVAAVLAVPCPPKG